MSSLGSRVQVPDQAAATRLLGVLSGLGQVPFSPPNVAEWPSGSAWLSTAAADLRMTTAVGLVARANLEAVSSVGQGTRVAAVGHLLGIGDLVPAPLRC